MQGRDIRGVQAYRLRCITKHGRMMRRKKKGEQLYKWARGKGWVGGLSGTLYKDGQVGFPVPLYFYDQSCPWMQSHSQITSGCVFVCVL